MKNKKLFAILTLVCFMFTLMPVAAFADEQNVSDPYVKMDAKYASVDVNEDAQLKIMIPGGTKATTTFYVFAVNGNALSNKLADADGAADGFSAVTTATNCGFTMLAKDSVATTTSETVNFEFTAPGEYQVYVVKSNDALDAFVDGMDLLTNDIKGTLTRFAIGNPVTVKVAVPEMTYGIEATTVGAYNVETPVTTTAGVTVAADNGFSSATMNFKLKMYTSASQYKWVEGAELNVYTDSHAVKVTKLTAATDVEGGQKFQISATIPGNYNVYVSYGEVTVAYPVNVTAVGSTEVSVLNAPTAPTNVKTATTTTSGIVFQLTDANGYVMKGVNDGDIASEAKVTLLSAPAGFDRPGLGYALVWESATTSKVAGWVIAERTGASTTANDRLDEEGTYTFKVALQNGASATASVTVDKFGKAVKVAFANVPESVVFNTQYDLDTTTDLILIDEKGVTTPVVGSGMGFTLTANGAAVVSFAPNGDVYEMSVAQGVTTPEKFVGSNINMFLVVGSGANAMTATAEMVVSAPAATVDVVDTEVAVGKTVVLKAELKDASGNKIDVALDDVKVVILGQDPYHGPRQAHGLSFSVQPGVAIPPSLVNIYKELQSDLGCYIPNNGYLKSWADQDRKSVV